jgi:hypothetical protein
VLNVLTSPTDPVRRARLLHSEVSSPCTS